MIKNLGKIKDWESLHKHELCSIFPEMNDDDYSALVKSMTTNGFLQSDPIVLINTIDKSEEPDWENEFDPTYQILDGQNRFNAALDADVKPIFVEYQGDDPTAFVTARNFDRRHLTTGQKAAIASALAGLANGQNSTEGLMSQAEAAKVAQVGEASLRRFKMVERNDPELAEKVKSGEVGLEEARTIVKENLDQANDEKNTEVSQGKKDKEAEKDDFNKMVEDTVNALLKKHELGLETFLPMRAALRAGIKIGEKK